MVALVIASLGAVGGLGVLGSEDTVVTLPFSSVVSGVTALTFENGSVVDPALAPIPGISFGGPVGLTSP